MSKWTQEQLIEHLKTNLGEGDNYSYSAAVVVSALYKKIYGSFPAIGLSGFQAGGADSIIEQMPEHNIKEAMTVLTANLKSDSGLHESWKANIAMAFKDEYKRSSPSDSSLHEVANKAAENFLDNLCR